MKILLTMMLLFDDATDSHLLIILCKGEKGGSINSNDCGNVNFGGCISMRNMKGYGYSATLNNSTK